MFLTLGVIVLRGNKAGKVQDPSFWAEKGKAVYYEKGKNEIKGQGGNS